MPGVGDNRPCDLATLLLSAVVQEREEISQQLARVAEGTYARSKRWLHAHTCELLQKATSVENGDRWCSLNAVSLDRAIVVFLDGNFHTVAGDVVSQKVIVHIFWRDRHAVDFCYDIAPLDAQAAGRPADKNVVDTGAVEHDPARGLRHAPGQRRPRLLYRRDVAMHYVEQERADLLALFKQGPLRLDILVLLQLLRQRIEKLAPVLYLRTTRRHRFQNRLKSEALGFSAPVESCQCARASRPPLPMPCRAPCPTCTSADAAPCTRVRRAFEWARTETDLLGAESNLSLQLARSGRVERRRRKRLPRTLLPAWISLDPSLDALPCITQGIGGHYSATRMPGVVLYH